MNCILFTRTSTNTQLHVEQIDTLTRVCQEKGWDIKLTYEEVGSGLISGNQRPTLTQMLKDIPANPGINYVVVTNISRLSCRVNDVQKLMQWLHDKNIAIYIANLDLLSIGNEAVFIEQAAIAEQQISDLKNNIIQSNKLKIGRKEGWKKPIKRYQDEHQDIIDLLNNGGDSIRKIASITKKSTTTVQKVKRILIQMGTLVIHPTL
jgi:DNA invertase Pin-like site-specific DNA recombinase